MENSGGSKSLVTSKFILAQMEEGDKDNAWPEDMESRRIADLEKFLRNNPGYEFEFGQLREGNGNRSAVLKGGRSTLVSHRPTSLLTKRGRPKNLRVSQWTVEATLELLEAMKAFVKTNRLNQMGTDIEKWKAIAMRISSPRGLELTRFARRSQVRFEHLRRTFKKDMARIEIRTLRSLKEYLQVCEQNQARTTSSRLPPPSPATKIHFLGQKSSEVLAPPKTKREDHTVRRSDHPCTGSDGDSTGSTGGFGTARRIARLRAR